MNCYHFGVEELKNIMSKLVIFGDSFADRMRLTKNYNSVVWYELLADRLNLQLHHYGMNGTSIEYSILKLYQYLNSDNYSTDDVIIFVCTSSTRVPLVHENLNPKYAAHWLKFLQGELVNSAEKDLVNHYQKNNLFYKTLFSFFNYDLAQTQKSHAALLLKTLPNTAVIMTAFDDILAIKPNRKVLNDTDNFLLINANLFAISTNEFAEGLKYDTFRNFFKGEVRNSHLGTTNNNILAQQLYNCIKNKSSKHFIKEEYKKNYIKLEINNTTKEIYDYELVKIWRENLRLED